MIFGGLEIVAGGYLVHRHYRKKNEKERLEQEAQNRRHHTFPGANSNAKPSGWSTQAQLRPQNQVQPQQSQSQHTVPQRKFAYHVPTSQPLFACHQPVRPVQPVQQSRPQAPAHTQSFNIPRRPVPERKPQIIFQPSLQRTDSFATLSRMPIANGSRPQDLPEEQSPQSPPRSSTGLLPAPQHNVYGNAGFSISSPSFGATPTSPPLTYIMATTPQEWHSVDDNWETYGHSERQSLYAPTVSTQLGEREPPPPPYTP